MEAAEEDGEAGMICSWVFFCVSPGIKDLNTVPEARYDPNSAFLSSPIPHHPLQSSQLPSQCRLGKECFPELLTVGWPSDLFQKIILFTYWQFSLLHCCSIFIFKMYLFGCAGS